MAGTFRKIATEEAFSIPEVAEMLREVSRATRGVSRVAPPPR